MLQPTNRTHRISDQVIEQIGYVILSSRFKSGDKGASEKELMPGFGNSEETPASISIVKSENLIKGEEIRYGD